MLRSTGTNLHGQSRPYGHRSRKGKAMLQLVLLLLSLAAPDNGQNLDPSQPRLTSDSTQNLDPNG